MKSIVEKILTTPTGASSLRSTEVILRTRSLSKEYGSRRAVDNLNIEVYRGEIFGFLGPNGAGKTTTIRMALGLIAPTAGSVEILGLVSLHFVVLAFHSPSLIRLLPSFFLYSTNICRNSHDLMVQFRHQFIAW